MHEGRVAGRRRRPRVLALDPGGRVDRGHRSTTSPGPATAGTARSVAQLSPSVAERTGNAGPDHRATTRRTVRFPLYEAVSTFIRQAGAAPGRRHCSTTCTGPTCPRWSCSPTSPRRSASGRSSLVAAYRDLPADRTEALADTLATVSREDAAHELALSGLAPDDVATLTRDLAGRRAGRPAGHDERFATMLHDRTGGNPFFVRQLVRLMLESESGSVDPARRRRATRVSGT